jgi:hypothetical protein
MYTQLSPTTTKKPGLQPFAVCTKCHREYAASEFFKAISEQAKDPAKKSGRDQIPGIHSYTLDCECGNGISVMIDKDGTPISEALAHSLLNSPMPTRKTRERTESGHQDAKTVKPTAPVELDDAHQMGSRVSKIFNDVKGTPTVPSIRPSVIEETRREIAVYEAKKAEVSQQVTDLEKAGREAGNKLKGLIDKFLEADSNPLARVLIKDFPYIGTLLKKLKEGRPTQADMARGYAFDLTLHLLEMAIDKTTTPDDLMTKLSEMEAATVSVKDVFTEDLSKHGIPAA